MSDAPPPRSHAMTWLLSTLGVLVIYAASWPVVEIKTTYLFDWNYGVFEAHPHWVDQLYGPMQYLRLLNGGRNPLASYYQLWEKWLPKKNLTVIHSK